MRLDGKDLFEWRQQALNERKRCADICLSIAERSRNSLFRSGAKICAMTINENAPSPRDADAHRVTGANDKGQHMSDSEKQ